VIAGGGKAPEYNDKRTVVRAIGFTTVVTAIGYGITLLQQILYARTLGVNADTDALGATLAWAIGTTGFVGTSLASVFVPGYVRESRQDPVRALRARRRATFITICVGGTLMLTTAFAAPFLASVLAPGVGADQQAKLVTLLRIAAPLEIIWPIFWLAVSVVNARERYVLAAASTVIPPIPVILLLLAGRPTVESVIVAYIVGAMLQVLTLWGVDRDSRPALGISGSNQLGRHMVPVAAAFGFLSLIPLEVRGLASLQGTGAVAVADYASRLVLAGQQVMLSGLLAVTFTRWSKGRLTETRSRLDSMERTVLVVATIGVVVAFALPLVSVELTRIVFAGGRFTYADAADVGTFIGWMAPGIGAHMVLMGALRGLLARGRTRPVVIAGASAAIATLATGWLAQRWLGVHGVAVGYSAGYLVAAAVLLVAVWGRRPMALFAQNGEPETPPQLPREPSLIVPGMESA
jgi:putative peptidoglycan lipid II flippase